MSTWIVRVTYKSRRDKTITVEANGYSEAIRTAQAAGEAAAPPGFDTFVDPISQEGEPWLERAYVCRGAYPTVIVCERAHGHRFTEADVTLIHNRMIEAGYTPIARWNGPPSASISIGCSEIRNWDLYENPEVQAEQDRIINIVKQPRPET